MFGQRRQARRRREHPGRLPRALLQPGGARKPVRRHFHHIILPNDRRLRGRLIGGRLIDARPIALHHQLVRGRVAGRAEAHRQLHRINAIVEIHMLGLRARCNLPITKVPFIAGAGSGLGLACGEFVAMRIAILIKTFPGILDRKIGHERFAKLFQRPWNSARKDAKRSAPDGLEHARIRAHPGNGKPPVAAGVDVIEQKIMPAALKAGLCLKRRIRRAERGEQQFIAIQIERAAIVREDRKCVFPLQRGKERTGDF